MKGCFGKAIIASSRRNLIFRFRVAVVVRRIGESKKVDRGGGERGLINSTHVSVRHGAVHEGARKGEAEVEVVQVGIGGVRHPGLGQRYGGRYQQSDRVLEPPGRLRAGVDNDAFPGAEFDRAEGAATSPGPEAGSS